jgi:ATP-dependent RNA helicase RhlE
MQKLVIDEFDEMLNLGFRTQLTAILWCQKKRQNILFSNNDRWSMLFWMIILIIPKKLPSASGTTLENIKQITYNVPNFNTKVNLLTLIRIERRYESRFLVIYNKKISDMLLHGKISRILMVNLRHSLQ